MMNTHVDPIGALGCPGVCPKCGGTKLSWNTKTDVTRCPCGWSNEGDAAWNRERRRENGELGRYE